jgi:hypothetical protein
MTKPIFTNLSIRSLLATIALICLWMGLNTFLNEHIWEGMTVNKSALTELSSFCTYAFFRCTKF